MKTLKIFLSVLLLIFVSYLLSCDLNKESVSDNPVKITVGNNFDTFGECNEYPDRCSVPSNCEGGKGEHFCMIIYYGDTNEEFDYENIKTIRVTHTGKDCNNNDYNCNYIIPGGGQTYMGCVLPWCDSDCVYTRSVCFETFDNKFYTGSRTFGYVGYSGCQVTVYQTEGECDFGSVERNDS